MLITPGATAYLLTDRFSRMLLIAPALAVASALIGIYTSYYVDASSGGMVVLAQGTLFTVTCLFAPRHGLVPARLRAAGRRRWRPDPLVVP